ncbi:MAG: cation:proton antiporter [Spirochaetaceae bacterium]|nr:MAG: cation:proton antiporter [Spirochaetaceae bacterium]
MDLTATTTLLLDAAILLIVLGALVVFVRILKGPTQADRIVAGSVVGTMLFSCILLLSVRLNEPVMIDVALVYAVLQFVDLIIYAKYLGRR